MDKILFLSALIVFIILLLTYIYQNFKFQKSFYGKSTKAGFFKILFDKGARGEYRTSNELEKIPYYYKMLYNTYLPRDDGTTEVDIIMPCEKGIFVIENKNYSGWIFGNEKSKNWCQTLNGKKYFFYNPTKQNKSHIKFLNKILGIPIEKYISFIIFNSNATLKDITIESDNLFVIQIKSLKKQLLKLSERPNILTIDDINNIYDTLLPFTQVTEEQKKKHIADVEKYKKSIEKKL